MVNYSDLGEKVMIVDSGAPVSLVGSKWLHQYLEEFSLTVEEMESLACKEVFRFGPSKRYLSTLMVEIPLIVQRIDGKEDILKVQTYIVAAEVPFLCGKRTLRLWKSKLDMEKNILEISVDGAKKEFRVIDTIGNHFGIVLETNRGQNSSVFFMEDQEDLLTTFDAVKKVHEVNNHKKKEQLLAAYCNAGWMSTDLVDTVNRVVNDCRVCQKFEKSVTKLKITLPKSTGFNEVVTLDLKEFGSKYVLWMICSFSRFM